MGCGGVPTTVSAPSSAPIDVGSFEATPAKVAPIGATEKERAVASAYLRALAAEQFEGLAEQLDDQVHFSLAGAVDRRGKKDAVAAHRALFGALSHRRVEASRVLLTESSQVVEWVMSGEAAAGGKAITIAGVSLLWNNDDGSITDLHLFVDEAQLAAQLGRAPKGYTQLPLPPARQERANHEQKNDAREAANLEVAHKYLESWRRGDDAALGALMTDDVELISQASEPDVRGRGEARQRLRGWHHAIDPLDALVDNYIPVGDLVVVEFHFVGQQRAPIGWVPLQAENVLKAYFVDVLELREGKIARVVRYENPMQLVSVLTLSR